MCFDIPPKHQQSLLISPICLSCCYSSDISAFLWFQSAAKRLTRLWLRVCACVRAVCVYCRPRQRGNKWRLIWERSFNVCVYNCCSETVITMMTLMMMVLFCPCSFSSYLFQPTHKKDISTDLRRLWPHVLYLREKERKKGIKESRTNEETTDFWVH